MSWWGKIVGGTLGFMMGGPIGALLGVYAGHNFDSGLNQDFGTTSQFKLGSQERVQAAFFTATFSILGYISKADGHVSKSEINLAKSIMDEMQLSPELKKAAQQLFNQGKKTGFDFESVLQQLKREVIGRSTLLQLFLEIQIRAASADGAIDSSEKRILEQLASLLGFDNYQLASIISRVQAGQHYQQQQQNTSQSNRSGLANAYQILGLDASCSDQELKRTYRRLMAQHHPDKLVAKGLPEEMIKLATEKTQEIKGAYDIIRKARKK